ncbi:MAG: (deoxy)nucleoside triphosphate pyrophosphohydrolase [Calditrichia bacterium]
MNKSDQIIPVLAAIIYNEDNAILLAQRGPKQTHSGLWEFPGGKLRPGEDPCSCLRREIKEELGLSIQVDEFFEASNYQYPGSNILLLAYRCTLSGGKLEPVEHQMVKWLLPEELTRYEVTAADLPIIHKLQRKLNGRV